MSAYAQGIIHGIQQTLGCSTTEAVKIAAKMRPNGETLGLFDDVAGRVTQGMTKLDTETGKDALEEAGKKETRDNLLKILGAVGATGAVGAGGVAYERNRDKSLMERLGF